MTKEEILSNNKIIAEFMSGNPEFERKGYLGTWFKVMNCMYPSDQLFYHGLWEWLMPVVEKIEAMDMEVVITKSSTGIYSEDQDDPFESICFNYGRDKLSATYQAVVSFIKQVKG